jgi:hypothetical protein
MRERAETIYFDTNAFCALCGPGPREREALWRLRHAVKHGRAHVLVTVSLTLELAPIRQLDPPKYLRIARELKRLSRGWILRPRQERGPLEIRYGRRLRRHEAFFPPSRTRKVFARGLFDPAQIAHEAALATQLKDAFELDEGKRLTDLKADTKMNYRTGAEEWKRAWVNNPEPIVRDWVHDQIVSLRADAGLPERNINERDLVTVWSWIAFDLARIYIAGLDGIGKGRHDKNDEFDREHFSDASYATVLVTDDVRFRRIVELSAPDVVKVVTFAAWSAAMLEKCNRTF